MEQRTDVSTPAPYFCPPTPHVHAKSPPDSETHRIQKVRFRCPPLPPHLPPISRLLQQSVHELTVRCTSELTVYPTPKSVSAPSDPLGCQILCSAAVCAVAERNSCRLAHWFSCWWI